MTRQDAVESGVRNAIDTVHEKAMTQEKAYALLSEFVSDALSAYGFSDIVTAEDMRSARNYFPFCGLINP
jgi:hypothetical protein